MKIASITTLLFLCILKVFAQNGPFSADKKKDSVWIKQLIEIEKEEQFAALKKDSNVVKFDRMDGRVIYSPDSCLRIGQVSIRFEGMNNTLFETTVQYILENKILELKLPIDTDSYSFRDLPVMNIYKLPGLKASYLIISAKVQKPPGETSYPEDDLPSKYPSDEEFKRIEKMYLAASLVHIVRDSLTEIGFITPSEPDDQDSKTPAILSGRSLYLESDIKNAKHSLKPFLKYDPVKKELRFLTTYCDNGDTDSGCNTPYINTYSGTFKYKDTAFTLVSDTSFFSPSLESVNKTIAIKKFKTGNSITKVIATKKYEEVGQGILPVLYVDYHVQSQSIGYVNYMFGEETGEMNFKPDHKVQKDSGLIFLVTDVTTPNHSGMCGGCEYDDSSFWLIKQNRKKLLFSFSWNSNSSYTTYTYHNGRSDIKGRFYLENDLGADEHDENSIVDNAYWKNNNTYVFHVSDETFERNFYVHFVTVNRKTIAKLIIGKLQRKKALLMHKKALSL